MKLAVAHLPAKEMKSKLVQKLQCVYEAIFRLKLLNGGNVIIIIIIIIIMGDVVAQLVEALRYKSEGRGFDSRWCHCNFSLT